MARPYPQVSTLQIRTRGSPRPRVRTTNILISDHSNAVRRALEAIASNQAVLWIRSTGADALDDYHVFRSAGASALLHHSRFADIDRQYLDREVLRILGPSGQRTGVVIVGTQTLEQSLDIDADLLVTDAIPADVLLQRLGRLHRHRTNTEPTAIVLEPGGLERPCQAGWSPPWWSRSRLGLGI